MEEIYRKIKCSNCKKPRMLSEEDCYMFERFNGINNPPRYDFSKFLCKKCEKEIESKRQNTCKICNKQFKPEHEEDYKEICYDCYDFITNDYKPDGLLKEIFDLLPSSYGDSSVSEDELAILKYNLYNLINKYDNNKRTI